MKKVKEIAPKTALESELESLPDKPNGKTRNWTKIQDDLILKFVPTKGVPAVSAVIGISEVSVRRRYRVLKGGK